MQTDKKTKDLDDVIRGLMDDQDRLRQDPRFLNIAIANYESAGKIITAIAHKTHFSILIGEEPDRTFIGKLSGVPLKRELKPAGLPKLLDKPTN